MFFFSFIELDVFLLRNFFDLISSNHKIVYEMCTKDKFFI